MQAHEHTQSGRMQASRQATIHVRASRLNRDKSGDNSETGSSNIQYHVCRLGLFPTQKGQNSCYVVEVLQKKL